MALIIPMLMVFLAPTLHVYATTSGATPGNALSPSYYDGVCISPDGIPGTKKFQLVTAAVVTKLVFLNDLSKIPSLLRLVETCIHLDLNGYIYSLHGLRAVNSHLMN